VRNGDSQTSELEGVRLSRRLFHLRRPLIRLLVAHWIGSALFYPVSLGLLPLLQPAFRGLTLQGVHLTNTLLLAPISTPVLLIINTLDELRDPLPHFPSNLWLWPNYLLPTTLSFIVLSVLHWRRARQLKRFAAGLCPACGYDLRASKQRCPECGKAIPSPSAQGAIT